MLGSGGSGVHLFPSLFPIMASVTLSHDPFRGRPDYAPIGGHLPAPGRAAARRSPQAGARSGAPQAIGHCRQLGGQALDWRLIKGGHLVELDTLQVVASDLPPVAMLPGRSPVGARPWTCT
jgi:hypothetical protein